MTFNLLGDYGRVSPQTDLDLWLGMLPFHLNLALRLPVEHSRYFTHEQCQSYKVLREALVQKDIDAIHRQQFTYNLVQAVLNQECTVEQAGSLTIFYVAMCKCAKLQSDHGLTDWREGVKIEVNSQGEMKFLKIDDETYKTYIYDHHFSEDDILRTKNLDKSLFKRDFYLSHGPETCYYVIPSLSAWNERSSLFSCPNTIELFPVLGAFNLALSRYAFGVGRRLLTVPLYAPKALLESSNFQNMTSAHDGACRGYFRLITHDFGHGFIEIKYSSQRYLRMALVDKLFFMKTQKNQRKVLKLISFILDIGIGEELLKDIGKTSFLSVEQKAMIFKLIIFHDDFLLAARGWQQEFYDCRQVVKYYEKAVLGALSEHSMASYFVPQLQQAVSAADPIARNELVHYVRLLSSV